MAKILAFAGSLRKDSWNKKLLKNAVRGAEAGGGQVTYIDLKDFPMPIYDQDIEDGQGIPEKVMELKELFLSHDALMIASPEYNASFSAALKNTLDWVSRQAEGEESLGCYKNKVAALLAASPGGFGGVRGLIHLRGLLSTLGCVVLPKQRLLPKAYEAFDETGNLKDEKVRADVETFGASLVEYMNRG